MPVVGYQRVAHEVDVQETQDRQQHDQEVAQAQQHGLSPSPPITPADQEQRHDQKARHMRPHPGRINLPARINKAQVQRHQRLVEIKPERPARPRQPRPERVGAHIEQARANRPVVLEPDGDASRRRRQGKEGQAPPQVAQLQPPMPPPRQPQQHHRQRDHRALAQERPEKSQQRQGVAAREPRWGAACLARRQPLPPLIHAAQVKQQAAQVQEHRQRVLALGYPGHGRDVDRVHGEDRRGQDGSRNAQPRQHPPQQHRAQGVQQHIHQVVAQRVRPPQPPFQP